MADKERKRQAVIHFEASEKLTSYLYDVMDEEGFGNTPTAIAQALIWKSIYQLIDAGTITRKAGKFEAE